AEASVLPAGLRRDEDALRGFLRERRVDLSLQRAAAFGREPGEAAVVNGGRDQRQDGLERDPEVPDQLRGDAGAVAADEAPRLGLPCPDPDPLEGQFRLDARGHLFQYALRIVQCLRPAHQLRDGVELQYE